MSHFLQSSRKFSSTFKYDKKYGFEKFRSRTSTLNAELKLNSFPHFVAAFVSVVMIISGIVGIKVYEEDIGWTFLAAGILLGLSLNMMLVGMLYHKRQIQERKDNVMLDRKVRKFN